MCHQTDSLTRFKCLAVGAAMHVYATVFIRALIFCLGMKSSKGGVSRLITQKSTAFMGKEAEPSVELCCAAKARSYSGEKCRGGKTVPTKSKNQNKLPKDSTECQTDL